MAELWVVRAQNYGAEPKIKSRLSEDEAEMWRQRFNTQNYEVVAMMRDVRNSRYENA